MTLIALALSVFLSAQAPVLPASTTSLVGSWTTTFQPPPGMAPYFAPSLVIAVKGNDVLVTMGKQPAASTGLVLLPALTGSGGPVLWLKQGPTRTVILRPMGSDQLRVEMHTESSTGPGRYHEEIFKRMPAK